jgi:hypothetical protein
MHGKITNRNPEAAALNGRIYRHVLRIIRTFANGANHWTAVPNSGHEHAFVMVQRGSLP